MPSLNGSSSFPVVFNELAPSTFLHPPFYYCGRPSLLPYVSDHHLSLFLPIVAYWAYSLLFYVLDALCPFVPWLERHRIHESPQAKSRNLASPQQVIWSVVVQQANQTILGLLTLDSDAGGRNVPADMRQLRTRVSLTAAALLGEKVAESFSKPHAAYLTWVLYWWGIPAVQFIVAQFVIDTWQYFFHRLFHANKFLYRHFHSMHHRLYVPYAFGAQYNHPLEGLLLDSVGALLAQTMTRMSVRQATLLFTLWTVKAVDDHCGYRFWFNPLQFLFGNNADYHDIHHQTAGIKGNFSQPFYIHWDIILGTRLTRQDLEAKKLSKRVRGKSVNDL